LTWPGDAGGAVIASQFPLSGTTGVYAGAKIFIFFIVQLVLTRTLMPLLSSSRSSKERTSKRSSPRVARNCPPSQLAVLSLLPEELEELLLLEVQLPSQSQKRRKRTKTWDSPSSTKLHRMLAFLECRYIYICVYCM